MSVGTAQNHSVFLYNNVVADFALEGIQIAAHGDCFVRLHNNVVLNHTHFLEFAEMNHRSTETMRPSHIPAEVPPDFEEIALRMREPFVHEAGLEVPVVPSCPAYILPPAPNFAKQANQNHACLADSLLPPTGENLNVRCRAHPCAFRRTPVTLRHRQSPCASPGPAAQLPAAAPRP